MTEVKRLSFTQLGKCHARYGHALIINSETGEVLLSVAVLQSYSTVCGICVDGLSVGYAASPTTRKHVEKWVYGGTGASSTYGIVNSQYELCAFTEGLLRAHLNDEDARETAWSLCYRLF